MEQIDKLAKALCKFQSEVKQPKKDNTAQAGPKFSYNYADLAGCWEVIKKPLADNGLSVMQFPVANEEGFVGVRTILMHESGQYFDSSFTTKPIKSDCQAIGSQITYYRRYALMAALGLAPLDDDGQAAMPAGQPIISDEYVVPFGKYKGQTLAAIEDRDLQSYVEFMESKALAEGKQITGVAKEFIDRVEKYLGV